MSFYGFRPYVPVAKRRLQAAREMDKLKKKGRVVSPVLIEGRAIARNFWGKAWCDNLERYSDYENRLPRGRTYVRNGSVVDLQIERGKVRAMVSGSEIYTVTIEIGALSAARWKAICTDCLGSVGSLVELLQGKLSKNVMERVCREQDGLFPSPREIKMTCSCPDWAGMCKHVAAALYGTGARLDSAPDLLFALRGVDRSELIVGAGADLPMTRNGATPERALATDDVAALFGIEMAPAPSTTDSDKTAENKRPAKAAAARQAAPVGVRPAPDIPKRNAKKTSKKKPPAKRRPANAASAIEALQPMRGVAKRPTARTAPESIPSTKQNAATAAKPATRAGFSAEQPTSKTGAKSRRRDGAKPQKREDPRAQKAR